MSGLDPDRQGMLSPGIKEIVRPIDGWIRKYGSPVLASVAVILSYAFVAACVQEDRAGQRTLAIAAIPVAILRRIGDLVDQATRVLLVEPAPIIFIAALIAAGAAFLWRLRAQRVRSWIQDAGLAFLFPLLAATMFFLLEGSLVGAGFSGLMAGAALLAAFRTAPESMRGGGSQFLVLIPLGIGLILRFYALAQVPSGLAEHAVAIHSDFSIPYFRMLSDALENLRPQPFLGAAWTVLVREHFGATGLAGAIGFELFGVSLVVTRLVSASLGLLTVYVAYRLGEELGGIQLGLVFSFFLAISPWHVTFSRYSAAEHVLAPLQFLLSLLFVLRALNKGRLLDVALGIIFASLAWVIYASNLVVPFIVAVLVGYRAAHHWQTARKSWYIALPAVLCFVLISYAMLKQAFPLGLLQPNVRTGYLGEGPLLADWPKRVEMLRAEVNQLFVRADDPWFGMSTSGGLGLVQAALLLPGMLLSFDSLRKGRHGELALLILLGFPIALLPAVFAPDASFRRLMLATTLAALAAAFVVLRLGEALRIAGASKSTLLVLSCAAPLILAGTGTFGYFDRASANEEQANQWFRDLASTVSDSMMQQTVIAAIPARSQLKDATHYIELMAYSKLLAAKAEGIPRGELFVITTCEDGPLGDGHRQVYASPPLVVLARDLDTLPPPCGPAYLSRLTSQFPGSEVVSARSAPVTGDLAPAPR